MIANTLRISATQMSRPPVSLASTTKAAIAGVLELLNAGRFEEAYRASLDILARDPSDIDARLVHGVSCLQHGMLAEAQQSIEAVMSRAPTHFGAIFTHAQVMRARGNEEAALAETLRAIAGIFKLPEVEGIAMRGLLRLVATVPSVQWADYGQLFAMFGSLLANSRPIPDATWIDEALASPILMSPDSEFAPRLAGTCALLGFIAESPLEWNREIFERLMMPWMRRALAGGRFDSALLIERVVYAAHVKQVESEAHFAHCVAQWKDAMREAGARFASTLPTVERAAPGTMPRVAFFVDNLTGLAHARMVADLIEGNARLQDRRFEPYVFCLTGESQMIERLHRTGTTVEVLFDAGNSHGYASALSLLRRRIAECGIDELVWVSVVVMMPFAFAMRIAPAQAWWAMKYHSLELDEIDGYITGGGIEGGTKTIAGRTWLAGPVASQEWTAWERASEAAHVRGSLPQGTIVYGTFGREEKLNSASFLEAVSRVLKAVPNAVFLWTGRQQHAAIQRHLEASGFADRCRFIGWVDTKLYAQVIDVFLDSFPFPCGFTLYEAAAAGRPAVLFMSDASADTGANALIGPLLDRGDPQRESALAARSIFRAGGEDLSLRASTTDEYVALAVRLGTDEGFRKRAGEAYRAFVESFLADRARSARIYGDHFLTIIEAAKRRRHA